MEYPISVPVSEFVDGSLVLMIAITLLFSAIHLHDLFARWRSKDPSASTWRIIRVMYWMNKPSIAINVILTALLARTFLQLHFTHVYDRGLSPDPLYVSGETLYLSTSAALIFGAICWIRNISPIPIANWAWILIIAGVFGFGHWVATTNSSLLFWL